jgi:hypothetical protein
MTDATPKAALLDQLAALGPFFAIEEHAPGSAPVPPWRTMIELVEDPAVLRDRVTATREYLAAVSGQLPEAIEVRVAASITHLGLAARLISPALATAVLDGGVRSVSLETARWQPILGGAFPLSMPSLTSERDLGTELIDGPIPALAKATEPYGVSEHILWGNVASAINGAATALTNAAPHLSERAHNLAAQLLTHPALREAYTAEAGHFRRRSCCLIYRAAPDHNGPVCGDCVLDRAG